MSGKGKTDFFTHGYSYALNWRARRQEGVYWGGTLSIWLKEVFLGR